MLRMKEGEDTPLYGYIGVSRPKEYGFLAILVRNRVLILAILGSNRVCTLVLIWVCFLGEATFSSLSIRPSTKTLHKVNN